MHFYYTCEPRYVHPAQGAVQALYLVVGALYLVVGAAAAPAGICSSVELLKLWAPTGLQLLLQTLILHQQQLQLLLQVCRPLEDTAKTFMYNWTHLYPRVLTKTSPFSWQNVKRAVRLCSCPQSVTFCASFFGDISYAVGNKHLSSAGTHQPAKQENRLLKTFFLCLKPNIHCNCNHFLSCFIRKASHQSV